MAETLANGTTIPQGSDPIHGSGVQAMRNLGGSVDGQLGNRYTKAQADALLAGKAASSHTHPVSQVTGLQAALDAKVGSADPRLSDARAPLPHGHQVGDVEGLDAALDAAGGSASWAQVADKPSVFPPSEHTHALAQVSGLQAALDAKARKEPVDLADQNLNDVIDEGPYVQPSSSVATAARNYPANGNGLYTAGFLDVVSRPGDYLVKQYFTAFNGLDTMWRTRYAGTWNQWRRTFRADEATPVVSKVAALEYDSGWRDLSGLLGAQYVSGEYWIRRVRNQVWMHFYQLVLAIESGTSVRPVWNLPIGFRPDVRYAYAAFAPRTPNTPAVGDHPMVRGADAGGPVRISRYGVQDIYNYSAGQFISADISFLTSDAVLTPPPGAAVTIF